jgi:hypothetical protein
MPLASCWRETGRNSRDRDKDSTLKSEREAADGTAGWLLGRQDSMLGDVPMSSRGEERMPGVQVLVSTLSGGGEWLVKG